jgi:hypothetical protein
LATETPGGRVTGERPLAAFFWLWDGHFFMAVLVEPARCARRREWRHAVAAAQELN